MRRHHVLLGTKTNVNGEVITAGSLRSLDGIKFAIEGDQIYCPACKSQGMIHCDGPRLPEAWMGVQFALEHDLCICGCSTPPRLLTSQTRSYQNVEGLGSWPTAATKQEADERRSAGATSQAQDVGDDFIEHHVKVSSESSSLLSDYRYDLIAAGNQHERAAALREGRTVAVRDTPDSRMVMWLDHDGAARHAQREID